MSERDYRHHQGKARKGKREKEVEKVEREAESESEGGIAVQETDREYGAEIDSCSGCTDTVSPPTIIACTHLTARKVRS